VFLQQFIYNGRTVRRHPSDARSPLPTGIYPTMDGWVQIGTPPPYADRLAAAVGDDALSAALTDPNWFSNPDVADVVDAALYSWLAERSTEQAMQDAQRHHWPVTAVRNPADVLDDAHFAARRFFVDVEHPVAGRLRQPGPPFHLDGGWSISRPAPLLDEHGAEIRAELDGPQPEADADRAEPAPTPARRPCLPLDGVRVVDLTVVWAGPSTTMLLGDLGADVIRVESAQLYNVTRGAVARPTKAQLPSLAWLCAYPDDEPGEHPWNRNAFFNIHARGKRSVTVDLRRPEGRDAFLRLVEQADVVVENNSVGVCDKLGIGWDVLRRRNPRLVFVRMPALGLDGPSRHFVGFGANFEAMCGLTMLRGYRDGDPSLTGPVYYMDAASGAAGAVATLLALRRRRLRGQGELVELAQAENMLNLIGEYLIDSDRSGRRWTSPGNRHLTDAPQGAYPCAGEDRWVVLTVPDDAAWEGLRRAMGEPPWSADGRFAHAAGRRAHHDELDRGITEWTSTHDRWDVARLCQAEGVPAGPVLDEADLVADPQLRARGFFRRNGSDEVGWHDYPGHLWHWSGPDLRWGGLCPLGGANDEVWTDIAGLTEAELQALRDGGHLLDHFVGPDGTPL
jgi:crotonobetainyl-CoA:carnitine CoA-transferase CaiB-like acyl-CoA transferase